MPAASAAARAWMNGPWLGDHSSSVSPSNSAVAFIGSIVVWAR